MATLRTWYRDVHCGRTHRHAPVKARLRCLHGGQFLSPSYLFSNIPAPFASPQNRQQLQFTHEKGEERGEQGCVCGLLPLCVEGAQLSISKL